MHLIKDGDKGVSPPQNYLQICLLDFPAHVIYSGQMREHGEQLSVCISNPFANAQTLAEIHASLKNKKHLQRLYNLCINMQDLV